MERLQDSRDILAFMTEDELADQAIEAIVTGIEDVFIAQTNNIPFSDEEIAFYAKEVSKGLVNGIVGYLKKNHNIDALVIKKAIESIDAAD